MLLHLLCLGFLREVASALVLTPPEDASQEHESLRECRLGGGVSVTASPGKATSVSSRSERGAGYPLTQQMLKVGTGGAPGGAKQAPAFAER